MNKINVFWHRRDLRSFDNAGLFYALEAGLPVLPVFIFDTTILADLDDQDDARVTFIHDYLTHLHALYQQLGSGLRIFHSTPEQAFAQLLAEYEIEGVYTNRDYEPAAKARDLQIERLLGVKDISFYTFKDQVIFEVGEILTDQGEPYKVFTPYKRRWLERFQRSSLQSFPSDQKLNGLLQYTSSEVPSLESLGFIRSSIVFPTTALDTNIIAKYAADRDFPAKAGTTKIGVHLRFGTVSIRQCVSTARDHSDIWLSELIWREFYMMILGHFPQVVDWSFKPKYDHIEWIKNEAHFERWCAGNTGYPLVDAGMRELNATGYMHNRVRMVVASFLTKHLLIDWRWGERYFARKLLDFELSSNNGGWQWAAGTGTDAQPYFRVFNPESQTEKFDPELKYIRRWVPEFGTSRYPQPIVNHKDARVRAIETYKKAVS